jgi:hypothetical protein
LKNNFKSENPYDYKAIMNNLIEKFSLYVEESQDEVDETFRRIDGEPAIRINLLIKQLSIMKNK